MGIHGLHRQREWDLVTTVDAPELVGEEEAWFVVVDGGRIVREQGDVDLARLAAAVTLAPPYRARAVRRRGGIWVVGARRIEIVELTQDPGGDTVELAWDGVERTVRIDGEPTLAGVAELERLGAGRHASYVVTASRLVGSVWEVTVAAL